MGQKLPHGNNNIGKLTNANLVTYCQTVHDQIVLNIVEFPNLPFTMVQFQDAINAYSTQLSASIKGSLDDRTLMRSLRNIVRNMLQQIANYINTVVTAGLSEGQGYDDLAGIISNSGLQISTPPSPVGPIGEPTIKTYASNFRGQLNILIKPRLHGVKVYCLVWGLTGSDQTTWTNDPFPNTRINKTGLTSGTSVSWYIFGKGANPTSTASAVKTTIIT